MEHGSSVCQCGSRPTCAEGETCEAGVCIGPCSDGEDNDADGWTDADDPDCVSGDEVGLGTSNCNDGVDNDGDGDIDADDSRCTTGSDHEVTGGHSCQDECALGAAWGDEICSLWDDASQSWIDEPSFGAGHLHNRARLYDGYLRRHMLAAGGVVSAEFADTTYERVVAATQHDESALWTGTYLGAQALRAIVTDTHDAHAQMESTLLTLHDWWNVSGDPGYLARYAARLDSSDIALSGFGPGESRAVRGETYEGELWSYIGGITPDQYQGVLFGYALAYQATRNPELEAVIREDVLEMVEVLVEERPVEVQVVVDDTALSGTIELDLQYCFISEDDSPGGVPKVIIDTSAPEEVEIVGVQMMHPNPAEVLRTIPGFDWLPDQPHPSIAIMVANAVRVALEVSNNVPELAARRLALSSFYEENVDGWLDIAEMWSGADECGDGYDAHHVTMLALYNLARLESDPERQRRIRSDILEDRFWSAFSDHKNVLFAYMYAGNAPDETNTRLLEEAHSEQLDLFPAAPRAHLAVDVTDQYEESATCPGLSSMAIDTHERVVENYMWQHHPWKMTGGGDLTKVSPGVDYLVAYWLGRFLGYLEEDAAATCTEWRKKP